MDKARRATFRLLSCVMVAIVLAALLPITMAWAAERKQSIENEKNPIVVTGLTASKQGVQPSEETMRKNTEAIQAALAQAAVRAYRNNDVVKVQIKDGTYYINGYLGIFSGTYLELGSKVRLVRASSIANTEAMLMNVHLRDGVDKNNVENYKRKKVWCGNSGCRHSGYTQSDSIYITGGLWDGNKQAKDGTLSHCIMSFQHAKSIVMLNTELTNTDGKHVLVAEGVSTLDIEYVRFTFHQLDPVAAKTLPEDYKTGCEAIHTDVIRKNDTSNSGAYPLEDLASENVYIAKCMFYNCSTGIGTHNKVDGKYNKDFNILNCVFREMDYRCITALNFENLTVKGCNNSTVLKELYRATDTYNPDANPMSTNCFLYMEGCRGTNVVSNNSIKCDKSSSDYNGCIILENSRGTVESNTIDACCIANNKGVAIGIQAHSALAGTNRPKIMIKGNRIYGPGHKGIYVSGEEKNAQSGCDVDILNNTVIRDPYIGYVYDNCKYTIGINVFNNGGGCAVKGNTVTGFQRGIELCNLRTWVTVNGNTVQWKDINGKKPDTKKVQPKGVEIKGIALYKVGANVSHVSVVENNTVRNYGTSNSIMMYYDSGTKGTPKDNTIK